MAGFKKDYELRSITLGNREEERNSPDVTEEHLPVWPKVINYATFYYTNKSVIEF